MNRRFDVEFEIRNDVYFALRFDFERSFLACYLDFCTLIWHIVGKDDCKWTKTDRDRQGQTRTRERERRKKNRKIKGQHGKGRIKKLRVYFEKSEDTSLKKSMDPLKFLKIWN